MSSAWLFRACVAMLWAGILLAPSANGAGSAQQNDLPRIGPAPVFALVDQDSRRYETTSQRGKVSVVTFIFAGCSETCSLLTAKLVGIQRRLGPDNAGISFAAVTVDPLNDTPERLKKYAQAHGANLSNFAFLTGTNEQVEDVARKFAVYRKAGPGGDIDHAFLTSLIDRQGVLRVQYLGTRFDPAEFETDLRSLLAERRR